MSEPLLAAGVVIGALMFLTWLTSLVLRDASIVDMVWGLGFVATVWTAWLVAGSGSARGLLVATLVSIWGLRLSGYLVWRNLGKPEDYRYRQMRARSGESFWLLSLFKVFLLQGAVMWIVALPIVVVQVSREPLYWLDSLGIAVWSLGLAFEAIGDLQLARFRTNPDSKGRVLDTGLWRYTRHPNYFGDFTVWWGHYLVALAGGAWWSLLSPMVMSYFLLRVSGVGMLEKTITGRRPGYADYIRRTNTFFPWHPRR